MLHITSASHDTVHLLWLVSGHISGLIVHAHTLRATPRFPMSCTDASDSLYTVLS